MNIKCEFFFKRYKVEFACLNFQKYPGIPWISKRKPWNPSQQQFAAEKDEMPYLGRAEQQLVEIF